MSEAPIIAQPAEWLAAAEPSKIDWLAHLRERGAAEVSGHALPNRRQEAWRYTPVRFLQETRFQPAPATEFGALQLSDIQELLLRDSDHPRLVFVNGYLAAGLCRTAEPDAAIQVTTLGEHFGPVPGALREYLGGLAERRHIFAALNAALMSDGALIHVSGDAGVEQPIEVLHLSVGMDKPLVCHPRHLIVVEPKGRAALIERYASVGNGRYFNNAVVEVSVGEGGELHHARLQEESREAQHLTDLHVQLHERARYRLSNVSLGGSWSRTDARIEFSGEEATAELDGLMLATDRQLNDVHLDIAHNKPRCTSRETFRGVLDGKGRVVFDGRILVAKDAQLTDAALSNDNLMLSRNAEVDTKPQLEIYADDVKCSHGTTVGELDANMLFYLRSRGIPETKARQMLCEGFASQIVDQIQHAGLRHYVQRRLAQRLGGND
jgi:Fe-S cluster assembly protein SufD